MIRPTEQWASEAAAKIQGLVLTSCPTNETIADLILAACPFQPKWEEVYPLVWEIQLPAIPSLNIWLESKKDDPKYIHKSVPYDTLDDAHIAAEEELMRRLKK